MTKTTLDTAAQRLFEAFKADLPSAQNAAPSRKNTPSAAALRQATEAGLARFYQAAREERERHMLGPVGRARVAFKLQQLLMAAGYPPQLVKQVLFAMLVSAFVGR